jgi:hypothetical protein
MAETPGAVMHSAESSTSASRPRAVLARVGREQLAQPVRDIASSLC